MKKKVFKNLFVVVEFLELSKLWKKMMQKKVLLIIVFTNFVVNQLPNVCNIGHFRIQVTSPRKLKSLWNLHLKVNKPARFLIIWD